MTIRRIAGVIGALVATQVGATDFTDTAQVISATPIYDRVADTRQECYAEPVASQAPAQERSVAAPILGGVAGAILGSQVGSGRGRDAAAAVGAVVGTVAADRVANPNSDGSIAGAAVGGAAGAILGNQVGRGSGRTAATAAGAVAGAVVGDRVATGSNPTTRTQAQGQQRCRTVDAGFREVVRGYTVVYRYAGRDITTTLPYNPGATVRVGVGVIDAGARPANAATTDAYGRDTGVPAYNRDVRPEPNYQYRY